MSSKKKTKEIRKTKNMDPSIFDTNVEEVDLGELAEEYGKIFAANTNILRHLAWVSGLKIGETRMLYALYTNGVLPNKSFKKVARVVADIMKLSPHGDSGPAGSVTGSAQDWNNNCCLIEPKGFFGNKSGKGPSASRYIECRMSKYAYKCFFEDFNKDIVDMKLIYSGDDLEPEFNLIGRYPHIMINGTFSIGQGVSPSVYPCNFNEVIDVTLKLMKDPKADFILYPDIPCGCSVIDEGQFRDICETGKGNYKVRGVVEIDEVKNGVTITSTTPTYSMLNIQNKLLPSEEEISKAKAGDLLVAKEAERYIDSIHERSKSDLDLRRVFYLKEGMDPYKFVQFLYKKTGLQDTKHVDMTIVNNYKDSVYSVRDIILTWLEYRRDYKRRYYNNILVRKYSRKHILEIIIMISNKENGEKTVKIMQKSENKADIREKLMKTYGMSSMQADAISDIQMYKLFSKESQRKYREELALIENTEIPHLEKLVSDKKLIDKEIKKELEEGMTLFGRPRRSKIITIENEQLIAKTNHTLVVTNEGFVKKLPAKITSIGKLKDNDIPLNIFRVSNATELSVIDENGNITKLGVYDIPAATEKMIGHKISELFPSIKGRIIAIEPVISDVMLKKMKDPYMIFITRNGIFKRTPLDQYKSTKKELSGINLKDGDKLEVVKVISGNQDLLVYTSMGAGVRIKTDDITSTNRLSIGTKGILMRDEDYVIGADIINKKDKGIFVLTSKGNAKISELSTFPITEDRKPLKITSLSDGETIAKIRTVIGDEEFKVVLKNSIEDLRMVDLLPMAPRMSKGKKHVPVRKGEVIITVKEQTK